MFVFLRAAIEFNVTSPTTLRTPTTIRMEPMLLVERRGPNLSRDSEAEGGTMQADRMV